MFTDSSSGGIGKSIYLPLFLEYAYDIEYLYFISKSHGLC